VTDRAPLRVGVVADMLEEHWPSMDLVSEMLVACLDRARVTPVLLRPTLTPRLGRIVGSNGKPSTTDRIINRFWDYPRWLRGHASSADVFHVIDHSYAHLAGTLPKDRVVVTCHDTDAFRPLVNGTARESRLPLILVRRVLDGLRAAAVVVCDSETTRRELVEWGLVPRDRTEVSLIGVHPACSPEPDEDADREAARLLGRSDGQKLLHVGSTIPRKRIDVLLRLFKLVSDAKPEVRLIRVGGSFTPRQQRLVNELGIGDRIVVLPYLDRRVLSAVYRSAALVLLPSEREGFGLPVVEAMACGTPVVASAVDVLTAVGGGAATYVTPADTAAWRDSILSLLDERQRAPESWSARRTRCIEQAARFSWQAYATRMGEIYSKLAASSPVTS
jgi:glycosyltransferase involved in cell wall biosynthesis